MQYFTQIRLKYILPGDKSTVKSKEVESKFAIRFEVPSSSVSVQIWTGTATAARRQLASSNDTTYLGVTLTVTEALAKDLINQHARLFNNGTAMSQVIGVDVAVVPGSIAFTLHRVAVSKSSTIAKGAASEVTGGGAAGGMSTTAIIITVLAVVSLSLGILIRVMHVARMRKYRDHVGKKLIEIQQKKDKDAKDAKSDKGNEVAGIEIDEKAKVSDV